MLAIHALFPHCFSMAGENLGNAMFVQPTQRQQGPPKDFFVIRDAASHNRNLLQVLE